MSAIKIAVADDQPMFRTGLVSMLNDMPGMEVVIEAANGRELINKLRGQPIDIVIIDYRMPEMNGITAAKLIREKCPKTKILMLSMYDDEEFIESAIRNGVNGYLTKEDDPEEINRAIESAINTGYYLNDRTSKILIKNMMDVGVLKPDFKPKAEKIVLTENEIMVIKLLAKEMSNKEIAEKMNKAERTIEGYRADILEKTGARNSIGIVMYGIKEGIIIL